MQIRTEYGNSGLYLYGFFSFSTEESSPKVYKSFLDILHIKPSVIKVSDLISFCKNLVDFIEESLHEATLDLHTHA